MFFPVLKSSAAARLLFGHVRGWGIMVAVAAIQIKIPKYLSREYHREERLTSRPNQKAKSTLS